MGRIPYQLKKRLYRLKGYRRKAYGIRSSFTSDLIINVIEAKLHFYAFSKLMPYRKMFENRLRESLGNGSLNEDSKRKYKEEIHLIKNSESIDRLQFRLMNFWHAKKPAYFGAGLGLSLAYLTKFDSRILVSWIDRGVEFRSKSNDLFRNELRIKNFEEKQYSNLLEEIEKLDFVVLSTNTNSTILLDILEDRQELFSENCMFLVQYPHQNKDIELFYERMKESKFISLSLDLFYLGILVAKDNLAKQDYVRKYRF